MDRQSVRGTLGSSVNNKISISSISKNRAGKAAQDEISISLFLALLIFQFFRKTEKIKFLFSGVCLYKSAKNRTHKI